MVSERVLSRTVCVIGAGPAGLVAARELRKEGHAVAVIEKSHDVGGQWLYDPDVEGQGPIRCGGVHSSVYASLRLVSPRETMGFTDFPFSAKKGRDSRRFPGHREVYLYLRDFCDCFGLRELVRFNTRVDYVGMVDDGGSARWVVRTRELVDYGNDDDDDKIIRVGENLRRVVIKEEVFDAVVVATGHYSFPKMPSLKGMGSWKRKQMHSHFYRIPEPFRNEVVVIVGNSLSGQDLSMELVDVAKDVYVSARSMETITEGLSKVIAKHQNLHLRPQIERLEEEGKVFFVDGSWVIAHTIIYCTGYSYTFPFLDTKGIVCVEDDKVGPLFEHTFPPSLAPSLTFIGIPKKIIGFPFFESQAKWIAQVLSGRKILPSYDEMMKSINEFYLSKQPNEMIHDIADFEYCDKYSDYVGFPRLEDWRKVLCKSAIVNSLVNLETYRDSYDHDHDLLLQAFESAHFTQQPESQALST